MRRCKWCGKTMILSTIRNDILCSPCLSEVHKEIEGRSEAIYESFRKMQESKTLETRLIHCDIVMEHYTALYKYEIRGIPTMNPVPSIFMAEYKSLRDSIIINGAEEDIKNILTQAWRYADPRLSDTEIDKAWMKIFEAKRCLHDKRKARSLEIRIIKAAQRSHSGDNRPAPGSRRGSISGKSLQKDEGLVLYRTK